MDCLYLIVRIAGQTVALPATEVGSVVEIDAITPVPRAACHVAGLFALRSRVLTAIDSCAALGLGATSMDTLVNAVIVTVDGHGYALVVEQVQDVVTLPSPMPCTAVMSGGWARVAIGQLLHEGNSLLLIDPARLIAGPDLLAA